MHIHFSDTTTTPLEIVLRHAAAWFDAESPGSAPHREQRDGGEHLVLTQLQDGVEIETRFSTTEVPGGTRVEFDLRMRGTSIGSRIRNLGMVPMTRIVRRAAAAQFAEFLHTLPDTSNTA